MLRMLLAMALIALGPLASQAQVFRPGNPVTDENPYPVSNKPNSAPTAALDSTSSYNVSSGTAVTRQSVLYSAAITLSTGQGPGRLMIWDRIAPPADGALSAGNRPDRCFYVDAGDRTTTFATASGIGMDNGISWAFSIGANCQTKVSAVVDQISISFK